MRRCMLAVLRLNPSAGMVLGSSSRPEVRVDVERQRMTNESGVTSRHDQQRPGRSPWDDRASQMLTDFDGARLKGSYDADI